MAALDVVTPTEAEQALHQAVPSNDPVLAGMVTAVSLLLDDQCGPVVQRTYTAERHSGGCSEITARHWPIASVSAFTNYAGTTGTAWTEITPGLSGQGYVLTPRESGTGTYTGTICSADGSAFGNWVTVSYTAGRAVSTTNGVPARFKQAAFFILENLWRSQQISVGSVGDFEVPYATFPASYAIPNQVRDLLGDDWRGERNRTMSGVLFG